MLKIQNTLIFLLLIVVGYLLFNQFKQREEIVYINSPKLLSKYEGMKDANDRFSEMKKEWQSKIDTLRSELESEMKKFEKERTTLSKKEIEKSEQLLLKKQQSYNNYQLALEKKAEEQESKLNLEILNKVNEFLMQYGEKNNYKFILGATTTGNILYAKDYTDITDQVLKELNESYKKK